MSPVKASLTGMGRKILVWFDTCTDPTAGKGYSALANSRQFG